MKKQLLYIHHFNNGVITKELWDIDNRCAIYSYQSDDTTNYNMDVLSKISLIKLGMEYAQEGYTSIELIKKVSQNECDLDDFVQECLKDYID